MNGFLLLLYGGAFIWLLTLPVKTFWQDDTDCSKIVWHTVRVPSMFERRAMWEMRAALQKELG